MRVVGNGVNVKGVKCRGERNNESDESERDDKENKTTTLRQRGRLLMTTGQRGLLLRSNYYRLYIRRSDPEKKGETMT